MKAKYDITNLLSNKPMNAEECARIIISSLNQESETGKGFLTYEEMISIRDGRKDDSARYNEIIEINDVIQLMMGNVYQSILNYKLGTKQLNQMLECYIRVMLQEEIIEHIDQMKGTSKTLDELKSIIGHTFNLTALFAYSHHKDGDFGWDNLKKAHINDSKDAITTAMKNRRRFMEIALAYRELVGKWCERIKSYYYQENFDALLEETMWCDVSLNNQLKILDEYYTGKSGGYDGFLKKELDREIKPVYTKDHESFLI